MPLSVWYFAKHPILNNFAGLRERSAWSGKAYNQQGAGFDAEDVAKIGQQCVHHVSERRSFRVNDARRNARYCQTVTQTSGTAHRHSGAPAGKTCQSRTCCEGNFHDEIHNSVPHFYYLKWAHSSYTIFIKNMPSQLLPSLSSVIYGFLSTSSSTICM